MRASSQVGGQEEIKKKNILLHEDEMEYYNLSGRRITRTKIV
jgi:hypothetical protein